MCIVAVINGAEYEFIHHAPVFIEAGGTQAQVDAMRDPDRAAADTARFDDTDRAALAVAIAIRISVPAAQRYEAEEQARAQIADQFGTASIQPA